MKSFWLLSLLGVLGFTVTCYGAKPDKAADKPDGEQVELFAAIESGDIEVKLICKDATTGNVMITNKTKKPLSIKLPDAFAGVPVAAQLGCPGGGFGGCPGGGGGGGIGGGSQGLGGGGGGFGGGGGGGFGGGGGGGGFFNVAPEKVGKIKVVTVCLEHGKDDPNPRIPYALKPIESFTDNQEVVELVKMVSRGEIDQHSGQAAAWHLANGMTWQELAQKVGRKHLNGATEPYFTRANLERALAASKAAHQRAEKAETKSIGDEQAVPVSAVQQ